jgi:hypothetical protein
MSDGITYRWLTEADLKEIVRKETEALRALLAEARNELVTVYDADAASVAHRINVALAKMEER